MQGREACFVLLPFPGFALGSAEGTGLQGGGEEGKAGRRPAEGKEIR